MKPLPPDGLPTITLSIAEIAEARRNDLRVAIERGMELKAETERRLAWSPIGYLIEMDIARLKGTFQTLRWCPQSRGAACTLWAYMHPIASDVALPSLEGEIKREPRPRPQPEPALKPKHGRPAKDPVTRRQRYDKQRYEYNRHALAALRRQKAIERARDAPEAQSPLETRP